MAVVTWRDKVLAKYPDAVMVSSDASYGIGTVKTYAVYTEKGKHARRLAAGLSAAETWRNAAKVEG